MIKLVLFDFTGVTVKGGHWTLARALGKRFHVDPKEIYRINYHKYFEMLCTNKLDEKRTWEWSFRDLNIPLDWKEGRRLYIATHTLNRSMITLADLLRSKGYRVAMLSKNHRSYFEAWKKEFRLPEHFDALINTQDLNLPKMSPKTLHYVLKRFRVRPNEVIYIDDQEANLKPARRQGVHTILYQRFSHVRAQLNRILSRASIVR